MFLFMPTLSSLTARFFQHALSSARTHPARMSVLVCAALGMVCLPTHLVLAVSVAAGLMHLSAVVLQSCEPAPVRLDHQRRRWQG